MNSNSDNTPADGTIIDLDPDTVVEGRTETSAPPPAAKPRGNNGTRLVAGAAALAIAAVGGGWIYRDYLSSYFPSNEMAAAISKADALEASSASMREQLQSLDRIANQLKHDVDSLEVSIGTASADAKAATSSVGSMSTRVDGLEAAIGELRATSESIAQTVSRLQAAPPQAGGGAPVAVDVSALTSRLEALEKDVASLKAGKGESADTAAISQALSDLKAKLAAGAPFADELSRVQRMVPAAPGLEVLAASAQAGLPTAAGLAEQLQALAPTLKPVAGEAATATAEDSWWAWASDFVSDVITIRSAGDADWSKTAEAAAAFAESGDLNQAMAQIENTEGARPAVLQQWLDTARARASADAALGDVEAAVLRMIAARS